MALQSLTVLFTNDITSCKQKFPAAVSVKIHICFHSVVKGVMSILMHAARPEEQCETRMSTTPLLHQGVKSLSSVHLS